MTENRSPSSPSRKATPEQILSIRDEWDRGEISTRAWADALGCSIETVRRIGRRDTCRGVKGRGMVEGHHSKGMIDPLSDEPGEAEVAGSLSRLQQALEGVAPSGREVDRVLEELTERGKGEHLE